MGLKGIEIKSKFIIGLHLFTCLLTQKMLRKILFIKKIIIEFLQDAKPVNQPDRLAKMGFLPSKHFWPSQ